MTISLSVRRSFLVEPTPVGTEREAGKLGLRATGHVNCQPGVVLIVQRKANLEQPLKHQPQAGPSMVNDRDLAPDIQPTVWTTSSPGPRGLEVPRNSFGVPHHGFVACDRGGAWDVWAPRASCVELVLVSGADRRTVPMQPAGRGWFHHRALEVEEGQRYWFRLDGGREFPDPASRWQPDGVHAASAICNSSNFAWTDAAWRGIPRADLVIYELHVGTFTPEGTFDAIVPRLSALKELGVTCLELMPVAQFPGHRGWGYDGVYPFAVQQSYGGPYALQRLVDACHAHEMAILLDVVYNHMGPEGSYLSQFGPYFSDRYRTAWGSALNVDGAGSDAVRAFILDNVSFWLRDFHFDGLRLDAIHAILDSSAVHLLREIQQVAEEQAAARRREVHVIAESNLNDVRLLQPPEKGGYGLAAQWSDDFHHCVHTLLTGENEGYYVDFGDPAQLVKALTQTFVYDGGYSPFRDRRHGAPAGDLPGDRFVISVQNHDQIGNRACGERLGTLLAPAPQRLAAGTLLLAPHIPLLFMGEEYGETRPFPYFCDFGDEGLRRAVRLGRRQEFADFDWPDRLPDPMEKSTFESAVLGWNWETKEHQAGLRRWYQDLLKARRLWPPLRDWVHRTATWHSVPHSRFGEDGTTRDQSVATASGVGQTATVNQSGVLELVRHHPANAEMPQLLAIFNFSDQNQRLARTPERGMPWHLAISSEWPRYGGRRHDRTWEPEGWLRFDWQVFPFEVLVFVGGAGRDTWKLF